MKKVSLILLVFILAFAVIHVSCKKEEENKAPEFTKVEFSLADTTATLTFSEAVYANSDGTGNLDGSDFMISYTSPEADTVSGGYVIHLAGNTTAKFIFEISTSIDGNEIFTIKPANGTSIYDSEGKAMEANQEVSFILE
ncbi:hypothetical protein ACFLQ9_00675 [Bacteroidota bacterium]